MVIIYNIEQEALDLCARLLPCKAPNDVDYTAPVKSTISNLWAVQVLDSDLSHLTTEEFSRRVELPSDWFGEDYII